MNDQNTFISLNKNFYRINFLEPLWVEQALQEGWANGEEQGGRGEGVEMEGREHEKERVQEECEKKKTLQSKKERSNSQVFSTALWTALENTGAEYKIIIDAGNNHRAFIDIDIRHTA